MGYGFPGGATMGAIGSLQKVHTHQKNIFDKNQRKKKTKWMATFCKKLLRNNIYAYLCYININNIFTIGLNLI